MNKTCSTVIHYKAVGEHGLCGKPASFENIVGAFCAEHWSWMLKERERLGNPPRWYQNGIAYGWDETRRDPSL